MKSKLLTTLTIVFAVLICGMLSITPTASAAELDPENTLYMQLKDGIVVIQMRPDLAPNHVKRIKELVRKHFYDGLVFHRVIDGFMAQTGDPTGSGSGGSGQTLKDEFSTESHLRGVVSMANTGSPNSADSQFFIMLDNGPYLNEHYTIWGKVVSGMEFVDKIKKGDPKNNGRVLDSPDKIITLRVAADVKK